MFNAHFQIIVQCGQIICLCYVIHLCIICSTLIISFGRKTYTCILKRVPLLYDVSEVRFHRSTQLFVPFDNGIPYCFSYAIVIAIKTNKYFASYRGRPPRIQRDVVSSSIRCLKAVVCIYTYIYIYIYICKHCIKVSQCPRVWHTSYNYE